MSLLLLVSGTLQHDFRGPTLASGWGCQENTCLHDELITFYPSKHVDSSQARLLARWNPSTDGFVKSNTDDSFLEDKLRLMLVVLFGTMKVIGSSVFLILKMVVMHYSLNWELFSWGSPFALTLATWRLFVRVTVWMLWNISLTGMGLICIYMHPFCWILWITWVSLRLSLLCIYWGSKIDVQTS